MSSVYFFHGQLQLKEDGHSSESHSCIPLATTTDRSRRCYIMVLASVDLLCEAVQVVCFYG